MLTGAGTPTRTQEGSYSNPKEEIEKPLWVQWSVHLSRALLLPSVHKPVTLWLILNWSSQMASILGRYNCVAHKMV